MILGDYNFLQCTHVFVKIVNFIRNILYNCAHVITHYCNGEFYILYSMYIVCENLF